MGQPYAPSLYRAMNGVFSIYKPAGMAMSTVLTSITTKLVTELNSMAVRPVRPLLQFGSSEQPSEPSSNLATVTTVPDLADHPLVVGARYQEDDLMIGFVDGLGKYSSGVQVMAIGWRRRLLPVIARNMYMRVYHVKGELGIGTQDHSPRGHIVEKATFGHVSQRSLDRILAHKQAALQRSMFVNAKVDPQSEEAYNLAVQGLIRPSDRKAGPMIYGMKCIEFNRPHFTLEIHSINENSDFLHQLINEIGLELRTVAICNHIRRLRYGNFLTKHALLRKHWNPESIVDNILYCEPLVADLDRRASVLPTQPIEDEDLLPLELESGFGD